MRNAVFAAAGPVAASLVLSLFASTPAMAQLRIVTMNASNSSTANSGPRTPMQTILSALGTTVLDDPTTPGNTGIFKPVDVLCLQEVHLNGTTPGQYAALLNSMYGTTTFSAGTMIGGSSGSGSQGVVFNSAKVQLLSDVAVGTVDANGMARQAVRHKFGLVGYDSSADFYIYNSHYKSSSGDTARRLVEATTLRNDADTNLGGGGKNIIYLGDYNVFNSSESGYQKLLSAGNGQAKDPINQPGSWNGNSSFLNIHTQTPYDAAIGSSGFDGAGGMDSRFDIQLISNNLNDRHGLAYIPNSYQAMGNNGSHQLGMPLNTGNGASPTVLAALSSILDHLPVGADYQLPSKMSVNVASVPSQVIVGASGGVNVTVTNSAPVAFSNGADALSYTFSGAGSVTGSGSGSNVLALSAGNQHTLNLPTAAPGVKSGTINVTGTSESVANGAFSQNVSTTVLAHAAPDLSVATIDFGIKGRTLGGGTASFSISNLADASGFTAGLDLDSINASGSTSQLTTNAATFSNLAAGSSDSFTATLDASSNGTLSTTYTLNFSDQDLPGATTHTPIALVLKGIVATPGDTDLNDIIDGADYARIDTAFNNEASLQTDIGGWINGDFDGNGKVDGSDYALIDSFFNAQSAPGPMQSVPEPAAVLLGAMIASAGMMRSRTCRRRKCTRIKFVER